jgi:hypothetical protein
MPFEKYYISLAVISIWRGFCVSGRKLLDPTTYIYIFIFYIYIYIRRMYAIQSLLMPKVLLVSNYE